MRDNINSVNTALRTLILLALATWGLLILSSFVFGVPAFGAEKQRLEVNLDRAVAIEGPISGNNLADVSAALAKFSKASTEPIDIVIDSPGGSVVTGFLFVNNMEAVKAKGITLRCFVNGVAASMAFQVLTHCDERYALSRSFLLWHRVRIYIGGFNSIAMTAPLAQSLATDLQAIDDVIMSEVKGALDEEMADEKIRYHFEQETLHIGANLHKMAPNFLTIQPSIPGLMEAFTDKRVARTKEERGFFGRRNEGDSLFAPGEIVYIYGSY